jgi:Flp pilus assembly protein CpaB
MASANIAYAFIASAGLAAIIATFGVVKLVESYQRPTTVTEKEVETMNVVVARRTLYQGIEIRNEDLWIRSIPVEYKPKVVVNATTNEVRNADVYNMRERVVGQVPRERILKNELIRRERLADANTGIGMNANIARGMRAISLDLRNGDAITFFLQPGYHVDVLVTLEDELGNLRTETLMQSVFIVGVNSRAENESEAERDRRGKQKPSVTFMVNPEQAEQLAYAAEIGDVSLSLRNAGDTIYREQGAYDIDGVLRRLKVQVEAVEPVARIVSQPSSYTPRAPTRVEVEMPVEEPRDRGPQIDIIRGGTRQTVDAVDRPLLPGADSEGRKPRGQ